MKVMASKNTYNPESVPMPYETLAEKLCEMEMSVSEFAEKSGLSEKSVSEFLDGKQEITIEMSSAFEKVTNIPSKFWLNLQSQYNEVVKKELATSNLLKNFRISFENIMSQLNYISNQDRTELNKIGNLVNMYC